MFIFSFTSFLSASLLFSIQLILGKRILPLFGGVASIWTTLMLFFLTTLFLGYLYVEILSRLKTKNQIKIHLLLIAITAISIAYNFFKYHSLILPYPDWLYVLPASPSLKIWSLVTLSIGPSFFLLSSTSSLLQHWHHKLLPQKSPYFLYALSNLGSLFGLLSYPFLIEPKYSLLIQEKVWSLVFLAYTACLIFIVYRLKNLKKTSINPVAKFSFLSSLPWLGLSTIPCLSLLSTTTYITLSISSAPFLWIIPLALYLISFIAAFSNIGWYSRKFHGTLLIVSLFVVIFLNAGLFSVSNFYHKFYILLFTEFIICFVCLSELYKSRPKPQYLTQYYLTISFGGVIGSIICSLVAPLYFPSFWEYPLTIFLAILAFFLISLSSRIKLPLTIQYFFISALAIFVLLSAFYKENRFLNRTRNFYGVIEIKDMIPDNTASISAQNPLKRSIINGVIDHGYQIFMGGNDFEPTTYYERSSGAGIFIDKNPKRENDQPLRIGVIGLGTGALAGYCQKGDYFRFYEINPAVIKIESEQFTFIKHCREIGGKVDIILGDGRLSLDQEIKNGNLQNFDFLAIDAFVDDAIPTHLLTTEAIQIYLKHLGPRGAIGFHISNSYLNLELSLDPTIDTTRLFRYYLDLGRHSWYLVSLEALSSPFKFENVTTDRGIKPWTDDYSNILKIRR